VTSRNASPNASPASRRDRRALERAERTRIRGRARPTQRPAWRSPFALVSLGAVALAAVVIVALAAKPPDLEGDLLIPGTTYPADLVDGESLGRADAPVVIEIWGDFQCPVCGRLAKEQLPRLVADFVLDGRLRIVSRDIDILGLGAQNESEGAAVAARCAGAQGRYWQFHDLLFWNQGGENLGAFRSERLALMADRLGLDRAAWGACRADPAQAAAIRAETAAAAARGIASTPTLSINGQLSVGLPRDYDQLAAVIASIAAAGSGASSAP